MNVLIACEESQTVCKAFRDRGFDCYSADIQEPSGGHPEWHILGDVLPLINPIETPIGKGIVFRTMDGTVHYIDGKWDLIIAHPPCTYLTNAGARWLYEGGKLNYDRFAKGMAGKKFFMNFYDAECDHIAIENPLPSSVFELPKYNQIIEPYMFGHEATKKTCLWLKGLPVLRETNNVGRPATTYYRKKDGTLHTHCWTLSQGGDRAKVRSKTFDGIAEAMAEQWGAYLQKGEEG